MVRVMLIRAKFWEKVDRRGDDECWPWTASVNAAGYGRAYAVINGKRRYMLAHRLSMLLHLAREPEGQINHKCDNPACVNPAHLYEGTQRENVRDCIARGRRVDNGGRQNARKTHCPQGHEYTEANTHRYRGSRHCRACQRAHAQRYRDQKKVAAR